MRRIVEANQNSYVGPCGWLVVITAVVVGQGRPAQHDPSLHFIAGPPLTVRAATALWF